MQPLSWIHSLDYCLKLRNQNQTILCRTYYSKQLWRAELQNTEFGADRTEIRLDLLSKHERSLQPWSGGKIAAIKVNQLPHLPVHTVLQNSHHSLTFKCDRSCINRGIFSLVQRFLLGSFCSLVRCGTEDSTGHLSWKWCPTQGNLPKFMQRHLNEHRCCFWRQYFKALENLHAFLDFTFKVLSRKEGIRKEMKD